MTKEKKAPKNLEEILGGLAAAEKDAAIDLALVPERTRPGMSVRKRKAEDAVEAARREYFEAAPKRMVGVVLSGPRERQRAFAAAVEAEGEGVAVDAGEMYGVLADSFWGTMGPGHRFDSSQHGLFNASWWKVLKGLGIDPFYVPEPTFRTGVLKTREEAEERCRDLVLRSTGPGPNAAWMLRAAVRKAFDARYKEPTLPVVVVGGAPSGFLEQLGKGWGEIEAPEGAGGAAVAEAFREVARQVKEKKANAKKADEKGAK